MSAMSNFGSMTSNHHPVAGGSPQGGTPTPSSCLQQPPPPPYSCMAPRYDPLAGFTSHRSAHSPPTHLSSQQGYQPSTHAHAQYTAPTPSSTGLISPGVSVPIAVPGQSPDMNMGSQYWPRLQ